MIFCKDFYKICRKLEFFILEFLVVCQQNHDLNLTEVKQSPFLQYLQFLHWRQPWVLGCSAGRRPRSTGRHSWGAFLGPPPSGWFDHRSLGTWSGSCRRSTSAWTGNAPGQCKGPPHSVRRYCTFSRPKFNKHSYGRLFFNIGSRKN